ncbi:MAG: M42 family metallopeptidase, partial [SAR324 cluster bacterium]|nr:M42 family metallopeptidase [SAR324 cluster bacterium]
MDKESKQFLYDLLLTPSASGYEQKIQNVVRKRMKPFAHAIETDLHGNVTAILNPNASRRVMLAGHCDQIALMVKHITDDGFIYFDALGGIDVGVLPGSLVTVHTKSGPIEGVIGRRPIHLQPNEERGKTNSDISKLWVDIGMAKKKDVEKKVEIGAFITFKLVVTELGTDLFSAPALDDKVGVFVAMEALRLCARAKLNVGLYAVSTVQEEVGLRGAKTAAYGIDPEIGIGIDVTHATDDPGNENKKEAPCKLGAGPCISKGPNTNPELGNFLKQISQKKKIPFQISPSPKPLGNDTNAIQVNKRGVATASIGIPNRYMHTQVEVCSYKDLE